MIVFWKMVLLQQFFLAATDSGPRCCQVCWSLHFPLASFMGFYKVWTTQFLQCIGIMGRRSESPGWSFMTSAGQNTCSCCENSRFYYHLMAENIFPSSKNVAGHAANSVDVFSAIWEENWFCVLFWQPVLWEGAEGRPRWEEHSVTAADDKK